jgi:glycosyltransferase involved in cell wall biosynthesis
MSPRPTPSGAKPAPRYRQGNGTVGVAIPTRDRPELLRITLASVVGQTRPPDHLVVVDNSQRDPAAVEAVCAEFGPGVVSYREPIRDLSFNENHQRALSEVTGEFVAVMQDDDLYLATFLERAVAALTANPFASLFAVNLQTIDVEGAMLRERAWPDFRSETLSSGEFLTAAIMRMSPVHLSGSLARSEAAKVTGFVESDGGCSDVGYFLRIGAAGEVIFLDEPLAQIRVHNATASNQQGWYGSETVHFRPLEWQVKKRFLASQPARLALGDSLESVKKSAARALWHEYWLIVRSRNAPLEARKICLRAMKQLVEALR